MKTWLSATTSSGDFLPDDYIAYRCDRSDGFGGVMIAHKCYIPSHQFFLSYSCELITCQLDIRPTPVILCAVYRAPGTDLFYTEVLCGVLHSLVVDNPPSACLNCW